MMKTFIGQDEVQRRIKNWILADYRTNVLFRGRPGSGKTTLARIYANAISGGDYFYHACEPGARVRPPEEGVVVLDEIHNLRNEEAWYDFPGTLIGCTTEGTPISEPFMTRMTEIWLDDYSIEEMTQIALTSVVDISLVGAYAVACRSRGCPRIAIKLGKELVALYSLSGAPSHKSHEAALRHFNNLLDKMATLPGGFTNNDLSYLETLRELGGRASLNTLAAALRLPKVTITEEIEPFLISKRLIVISPRGRSLVG